jgi:hypothetical protein
MNERDALLRAAAWSAAADLVAGWERAVSEARLDEDRTVLDDQLATVLRPYGALGWVEAARLYIDTGECVDQMVLSSDLAAALADSGDGDSDGDSDGGAPDDALDALDDCDLEEGRR